MVAIAILQYRDRKKAFPRLRDSPQRPQARSRNLRKHFFRALYRQNYSLLQLQFAQGAIRLVLLEREVIGCTHSKLDLYSVRNAVKVSSIDPQYKIISAPSKMSHYYKSQYGLQAHSQETVAHWIGTA